MVQNELEREKLETELEEERKSKLNNLSTLDALSDFGGSSSQVKLGWLVICHINTILSCLTCLRVRLIFKFAVCDVLIVFNMSSHRILGDTALRKNVMTALVNRKEISLRPPFVRQLPMPLLPSDQIIHHCLVLAPFQMPLAMWLMKTRG